MLGGKKEANVGANVGANENDEVSINIYFFLNSIIFFIIFLFIFFSKIFCDIQTYENHSPLVFFSLFSRHFLVTKHRTIIKCNFKVRKVWKRENSWQLKGDLILHVRERQKGWRRNHLFCHIMEANNNYRLFQVVFR